MKHNETTPLALLSDSIALLLKEARGKVVKQLNQTMVLTYYQIGRLIVEHEQHGKTRAEYGKQVLKELSQRLTTEFGKGFSVENLDRMRFLYKIYAPTISSALMTKFELSWSHYLKLMRMQNEEERKFYEIEAIQNNWSVRELERQYDSALYERLALSRDANQIKQLSEKGHIIESATDMIKDPYILAFIGLPEQTAYSENQLETTLINQLQAFLLELGKGFTYVGRQVRFTFDEEHFKVDLVFYNRLLSCFVLIDLKIGKLKHQDLGQMQMYVNYYDRYVKTDTENPTIGIILCKDKKDTMVEITLPKDQQQIFASRYQTLLPSKEELIQLLNQKTS